MAKIPTIVLSVRTDKNPPVLVSDPPTVLVEPGDTVQWLSSQGPVVVSFGKDSPFTENVDFTGPVHFPTNPPAVVRERGALKGTHFTCTITVAGHRFPGATGVDIRPPKGGGG